MIIVYNLIFNINAFSLVSTQQCDKELDKYCNSSEYSNTESRLKCVKEKKAFFTRECIVRILKLQDNKPTKKNDNKSDINDDILVAKSERILSNIDDFIKNNDDDVIDNNQKIILTLKENILRTNCLSDMSRLCNVKTKKGIINLKEPIGACLDKMIKRESRLTLNCHNAILNIINEENKQYTFYNVNGITLNKRKNLRYVKRKKDQKIAIKNQKT